MNNDVHLQALIEKSMQLKITHINTRSMISTYDGLLLNLKQYYGGPEGSKRNKKETAHKKEENAIKKGKRK